MINIQNTNNKPSKRLNKLIQMFRITTTNTNLKLLY